MDRLLDAPTRLAALLAATCFASWSLLLFRPLWGTVIFIGYISFVCVFTREILAWIKAGADGVAVNGGEREEDHNEGDHQ